MPLSSGTLLHVTLKPKIVEILPIENLFLVSNSNWAFGFIQGGGCLILELGEITTP